jgi:predicted amidohydrolase
MPRYVGIAGVQMEVIPSEDNSPGAFKLLQTVASSFPWVDIVLFSELCVCGMDRAQKAPMPNALLDHFCRWAKKERKWLIPGSFFEEAGRKVFNTAVVISPGGKIVD